MANVTVILTVDDADEVVLVEALEAELLQKHPWIPGAHLKKVQMIEVLSSFGARGSNAMSLRDVAGD